MASSWLCSTTLENWKTCQEHSVWGVKEPGARSSAYGFQQLNKVGESDRFIFRITKHGIIACAQVVSKPFKSSGQIWSGALYPQRVKIQPVIVNDLRHALPFSTLRGIRNGQTGELIDDGACVLGKPMIPLSDEDAQFLVNLLQHPSPSALTPAGNRSGSTGPAAAKSGRSQPTGLQNMHEAYLEELIASDLDQVEPGLTLIGRQHDAGAAGRIDLLCQSSAGDIVVVELKRIGARAVGVVEQTMAYVGWAHKHLAGPNQQVRGIIVGGKPDKKLQYAIEGISNLKFRRVTVSIGDAE
jgi:predicted RNA-binding protein